MVVYTSHLKEKRMLPTMDMTELHHKFIKLKENELVLDVRTQEEFEEGHIPGALNVSHEQVIDHIGKFKNYETIYVYCRSGGRVQKACHDLYMAGLRNLVGVVSGGMSDWIEHGFPVETGKK